MDDDTRLQELKEKEIIRLTTPLSYPKVGKFTLQVGARDCEGNPAQKIGGFRNKYVLEPKPGILSENEILMYAPESKEASKIRLSRGNGKFSDKTSLYSELFYLFFIPLIFLWVAFFHYGYGCY